MPDLTLTVTDAQLKVLRTLDARKTATAVVQIHVETWLAPLVAEAVLRDVASVKAAYVAASEPTKATIRTALGVAKQAVDGLV